MLRDLQKYTPGVTHVTAQDMNTLGQAVRIIRNFAGPNSFSDASGLVFRRPPAQPDQTAFLRIGGELDGNEVYEAYVQVRSTNTATFTGSNNAYFPDVLDDGERVAYWHSTDDFIASKTDPSGTNRVHTLTTGVSVVARRAPGGFTVMDGTNALRLYLGGGSPPGTSGGDDNSCIAFVEGQDPEDHVYYGTIYTPNSFVSAISTGPYTSAELSSGIIAGVSGEVRIVNLAELNMTLSHAIQPSRPDCYFLGRIYQRKMSGTSIVAISVHIHAIQVDDDCE